jgi:catechol 2,3-dioxygenase-like lactoylglutathione lyase family enzyme
VIDHLSVAVRDIERARRFYDRVLGTLGHARLADMQGEDFVASGYGPSGSTEPGFWIGAASGAGAADADWVAPVGQHIAFASFDRDRVNAFHAAGLEAGASDNGAPGIRAEYHPNYYAAFLIDPDGHHLEAVCHLPA